MANPLIMMLKAKMHHPTEIQNSFISIITKINARIFLSSFILYGFPEVTLDFSRKLNQEVNIDTINLEIYIFSNKNIFSRE